MESEILVDLMEKAFSLLYEKDEYLIHNELKNHNGEKIENRVGERAIVFRFGHYLQNAMDEYEEMSSYILDCEYNRNGARPKISTNNENGVYPDLIIHHRGDNKGNIIMMEFKTWWNDNIEKDIQKVNGFINDSEYHYEHGAVFIVAKEVLIYWCKTNTCGVFAKNVENKMKYRDLCTKEQYDDVLIEQNVEKIIQNFCSKKDEKERQSYNE